MKNILLLLMFSLSLFAQGLTPVQQQMLKQYGYVKKGSVQVKTVTPQEIKNDIDLDEPETKDNLNKEEKSVQPTKPVYRQDDKTTEKTVKKLKRYGQQFFKNKNKLNPYSVPTPANYVLNRGDKLSVNIYGGEPNDFELQVDRQGNIIIPQVGKVQVIGKSYKDAKETIKKECQKAYPTSTSVMVDIVEFSPIQVTVSGLVNAPGLYNLTTFSTIKDALIASGGVLPNGSYRNIVLKRGGTIYSTFDLYALIRYGDTSSDTALKNGDVIFVPPIKKEVVLKGAVNIPAIYELKDDEKFKDLFSFASGLKADANKRVVSLKRYSANRHIKVSTLSYDALQDLTPKNGDVITTYKLSDLSANAVTITGNIVAEGDRELPSDRRLSTLLKKELYYFGKKGFFKKNTVFNYGVIKSVDKIKAFNLKSVLSGKEDYFLSNGDEIHIYSEKELGKTPFVYVEGDVVDNSKQKYIYTKNMSLSDLFNIVKFKRDSLDNNETISYIKDELDKNITIPSTKVTIQRTLHNKTLSFTKDAYFDANFKLKPYDIVAFYEFDKTSDKLTATITGEVFLPKEYEIGKSTTINHLIKLAGGLTRKALHSHFEIARYKSDGVERHREIISLSLDKALQKGVKILPDDEVKILPIANWRDKKYITLKGQVRFPGRYAIEDGEKLSSVIERAGGFSENAFIEGAVFTRESVKKLQKERIQESVEKLRTKSLQLGASATNAGEKAEDKTRMLEVVKQLEKKAKEIKPIGRISINLYYDMDRFEQSPYDITLKDGDSLYIPTMSDTVTVIGEVLNPNTFVYEPNTTVDGYLGKAGGFTQVADEDHVYLVKANGEARRVDSSFFMGSKQEVFKGDTIVIPMKLEIVSNIKYAKDVTSILYQLAVTAASLHTVGAM